MKLKMKSTQLHNPETTALSFARMSIDIAGDRFKVGLAQLETVKSAKQKE